MANEVRIIDANKLKQGFEVLCKDERVSMSAVTYFAIVEFIDALPTIEVEPIHENPEKDNPESEVYCFDCIHNKVCQYCPHDGCDFKEKAESVKHGRWLNNGIVYTCLECNSSVPKNIFITGCDFEGCPYCFARMDGDTK